MLHDDSVIYDSIGRIFADKFYNLDLTLYIILQTHQRSIFVGDPVSDQIWWRIRVAFDEPH
jgi:hypothetical protein